MSNETQRDYRRLIINDEQTDQPLWNVVLTGDFAVIMTSVHARSEQDAEILARNFLVDYYDMNLDSFHTEATKIKMVDYGTE